MRSRLSAFLSTFAASMDDSLRALALAWQSWLAWPVAYAIALGSSAWLVAHWKMLGAVDTNKVPTTESYWLGGWVGIAFLAIWFFYSVVHLVRRRRGAPRPETFALLNGRLRPVLAVPFVLALAQPAFERDNPKLTFFFATIAAGFFGWGVYAWTRAPAVDRGFDEPAPPAPRGEKAAKIAAGIAVALLWAGYGGFFSYLSVINHHALVTRTIDLGYYDNIFWQSIHGKFLGCTFIKAGYHGSAHFDPLLVFLSPLYLLYPRAEFLLVLQSVWLGVGVIPTYLLAKHKLGARLPALALALMYALYPAMQGANMYEFHSLTLLSPIVLWQLWLFERGADRGRFGAYWAVLPIALLCREDVALLMCCVGLYAILDGRRGTARTGWITIGLSVVYFGIVKKFFMTSADIFMTGKDSYSFAYYYDDLIPNHNGIGGMLLSLLTNPVFVVKTMFTEPKIVYLLTLFVPLLFLPFFARTARVMLAYGMLFCLLASRSAVYSPAFQYSSAIIPIAFGLTPIALRQIEDGRLARVFGLDGVRLSRALLGAALVASLIVSWKFGGLLENEQFRGGFARVARGLSPKDREVYDWVRETVATIPPGASVGTTNKMGAHVSNRRSVFFYPERMDVDYVFMDDSELRGGDLDKHTKAMAAGTFVQVARKDKIALYKSVPARPAAAPAPTASGSTAAPPPPALLPIKPLPRPTPDDLGFDPDKLPPP